MFHSVHWRATLASKPGLTLICRLAKIINTLLSSPLILPSPTWTRWTHLRLMFIDRSLSLNLNVLFKLVTDLRHLDDDTTLFDWILNILAPGCVNRHHHILHPDSKHGHLSVLHACSALFCTPLLTHNCAATTALTSSLTSAKQWTWLIMNHRKRQQEGPVLITTNWTTCQELLDSGSSGFTLART